MRLDFKISREDYSAFKNHVIRPATTVRKATEVSWVRVLILLIIGLGIMAAGATVDLSKLSATSIAFLGGALAGALLLVVGFNHLGRKLEERTSPADDGGLYDAKTFELEADGIRYCSERHEAIYRWSLIREVVVTERHLFVMIDRAAGLIVPRHSFSSDEDCERFVKEIEERSGKTRTLVASR